MEKILELLQIMVAIPTKSKLPGGRIAEPR